jgi:hypothetical protein
MRERDTEPAAERTPRTRHLEHPSPVRADAESMFLPAVELPEAALGDTVMVSSGAGLYDAPVRSSTRATVTASRSFGSSSVRPDRPSPGRLLGAALLAGGLSGVPSTVHALGTGRSPLAAARAAGELLGRPGLARGVVAHALVTLWWTGVLAALVPRRAGAGAAALCGALGGAGIAALDLTIARRRFPAIAALPIGAQVADHVVFGAIVGTVLQWGSGPERQRG